MISERLYPRRALMRLAETAYRSFASWSKESAHETLHRGIGLSAYAGSLGCSILAIGGWKVGTDLLDV
jgi:hypothetical protein